MMGERLLRLARHLRYLWALQRALEAEDQCLILGILAAIMDGGRIQAVHSGQETGRTSNNGTRKECECSVCGEIWWKQDFNEILLRDYGKAFEIEEENLRLQQLYARMGPGSMAWQQMSHPMWETGLRNRKD
jgi:hypothetical protein